MKFWWREVENVYSYNDFECLNCGTRWDAVWNCNDGPPPCLKCGGESKKILSVTSWRLGKFDTKTTHKISKD